MLTKLLLAAWLVSSIVELSSGQQGKFNNLNLDKLSGFLNNIKSLEPITVRCDHLWIQMSIESRSYMLPKRGQRLQFEVEREDFKQLLDVMSNNSDYRDFLEGNLRQCLDAFKRYDREIEDDNKPFIYSREKIYDMDALVDYFDSFRDMDTPEKCSHFWMGTHVILFRRRPKLMQVFDKDEMVAMRDALNTQQNGQDSRESQMRNKLLNRMNMCLGQDIFSGSGQFNSGSYGMQQGNGMNNNGGYNVNVNFNGIQGINLLQLLGLGNIIQIASELHRVANNMDPARVCGWLSNHLKQQLSSNQQMLMNMGEAQLFGLYKEALKSHDGGQGPIHGLLDRCINQSGGAQQQYGYNQNRDFSTMSNNNYGGNSLNLGGPLGVAAGIGLGALAGHEMEQFVKNADRGLQSLWSNLVYHHQNDQFSPAFCAKLWANLRESVTPIKIMKDVPKLLLMANPGELEFLADRLGNIPVHRDRCENLRRCAKVLGEYRIQNQLGPIGAGFAAIGGEVGRDMHNLGQNIRGDFNNGLAATGAMVGAALGAEYLGNQMKNGIREFGNDIRDSSFVNGADYLGGQMKNGIREFGNDIRGSAIVTGADYLGDQMKNGIREMGDDIRNSAIGVGAQYLGGQLKNGIQDIGNDIRGSAIVSGADYLGDQMKNGFREMGREMKGDLNQFGNAVQNPGGWIKTEITREFSPQVQQFGNSVQQFGNSVQNGGQWMGQGAGHLGHLGQLGQAAVGVAGLAAGGALAANLVGNVMHHGQNQVTGGFNQMGVMQSPGFGLQSSQSFGQNSYGQPSLQASFSQGGSNGGSDALLAGMGSIGAMLANLDLHSLTKHIAGGIALDIHQCKGLLNDLVQQLGGVNMVTKHFAMHLIHPIEVEIAVMKQLVKIAEQRGMHQMMGNNLVNSAHQCALIFDNNRSMGNSSILLGNQNADMNMSGSSKQSFGGSRNDGYGHRHGHGYGHRSGRGRGPPGPCKIVDGACSIVKNVVGRVLDRID